jgi:hypothetical protein
MRARYTFAFIVNYELTHASGVPITNNTEGLRVEVWNWYNLYEFSWWHLFSHVSLIRVLKIAKSDYQLRHVCPSMSAWNNSVSTGRTFINFDIWVFFFFFSKIFKFHQNLTRIKGTSHEDQYTFLFTARSLLFRMRNVSRKSCRENQNTRFTFNFFFRNPCRLCNNVEK